MRMGRGGGTEREKGSDFRKAWQKAGRIAMTTEANEYVRGAPPS
jgi:hypothetical protein